MDEDGLVLGKVYDVGVRGVKGTTESLYIGEKRYYSCAPVRQVVVSRGENGKPVLSTFTRFVLKGKRLTMKHVHCPNLSDSERRHLDDRLNLVGL